MNRSSFVLTSLATVAALAVAAPQAQADRPASRKEAAAIKRVTLRACGSEARCRFRGARVSTRNARYAWADVVGEGYSGALVKRRTARSRRFRVVGEQGGGIGECSYWRARAPAAVLRDLDLHGLVDDSGKTVNCGKG